MKSIMMIETGPIYNYILRKLPAWVYTDNPEKGVLNFEWPTHDFFINFEADVTIKSLTFKNYDKE